MVCLLFTVSGTCASIGYADSCCPPQNDSCKSADGECFCNADCHTYGDCCENVYCPSSKKTKFNMCAE